jgi:hypothetical protein
MKKLLCFTSMFAAMLLAGCSHPQPVYYPPPPPVLDYQAIAQQGYHDGFEAARHDVATGRPPVFDHHPRFRNPPVPPPGWDAYRRGFSDGYNRFLHPAPPPPPPAY